MTMAKWQPGDRAAHKYQDLDSRPVVSVSENRRWITLRIGSIVTPPVPSSNYRRIPKEGTR